MSPFDRRTLMTPARLMSLPDGPYKVAGPGDDAERGLGIDGERLHEWLGEWLGGPSGFRPPGASAQVFAESMASGAVVVGRRTFDHAGHWDGDHHDESAMRRPSRTPATRTSWCTAPTSPSPSCARVLDELQIHLIPVLLGEGRRLFEHLGADHIELEPTPVIEAPGVTHLRYRVPA